MPNALRTGRRAAGLLDLCPTLAVVLLCAMPVRGQDPGQPATNLGLTSTLHGSPPGVGTYWFGYVQYYHARIVTDGGGNRLGTARLNTTLYLQQLVYIGKASLLGGNAGITALLPLVNINASGEIVPGEVALRANPGLMGDLVIGPNVQWFGRKLFGRPLGSRLEVDFILPTGSYDADYPVNAGSNFFTIEPHYTFTYALSPRLSTSQRHHYTYNFTNPANRYRTGGMYHANYALEYRASGTFRVAVIGYYLQQLTSDNYRGDQAYFRRTFNIANNRERVFAAGPGLSFITPSGLFLELKSAVEWMATNRPEGVRTTFRLIYRFKESTPPAL
jgi:hypothetical protein